MIQRRIVRRYASALFAAAAKSDVVDRVESDLGLVSYTTQASPELAEALKSPLIPTEKKREVLRDIFGDKVHEITLSYLNLLVDKRREEAISFTEEEFVELANEARGVVTAEVTTAVGLGDEEEARLAAKLARITGLSVNIEKLVDPAIIGGVLVKIGDTVIDGSVRGQLAAIKERLLS